MPTTPSPAQSEASRLNGARSAGPATERRQGPRRPQRRPPRPVRADILPPAGRGPGRVPAPRGAVARGLAAARPARACRCRGRHPLPVARGAGRPAGGGGADRPVRRRQARRPGRGRGRQGGGLQGAGHAAALSRPDRARAPGRHAGVGKPAPTPPRASRGASRANPSRPCPWLLRRRLPPRSPSPRPRLAPRSDRPPCGANPSPPPP